MSSLTAHQTGAVQQVDSAFFRYRAESIAVEPKIHQADIIRTAAIAKIHVRLNDNWRTMNDGKLLFDLSWRRTLMGRRGEINCEKKYEFKYVTFFLP